MIPEFKYDDHLLRDLWDALEAKDRRAIFRNAMRDTGRLIKKDVAARVKAETRRVKPKYRKTKAETLTKFVRLKIWKRQLGFTVTVGERPCVEKTYVLNRFGQRKPALRWLDTGTQARRTSGGKRKGHSTGTLAPRHWVAQVNARWTAKADATLKENLLKQIEKTKARYGLI